MPAMHFVPAIPGTHISINETYHFPTQNAHSAPLDLNPVEDWKTTAYIGLFVLIGCCVWCFGPSNEDERAIRGMFGQDMWDEKRWRKEGVFGSSSRLKNILVNFAFVFAWPIVAVMWYVAILRRRSVEKETREFEEALARANRRPMAGAETGKCSLPLM